MYKLFGVKRQTSQRLAQTLSHPLRTKTGNVAILWRSEWGGRGRGKKIKKNPLNLPPCPWVTSRLSASEVEMICFNEINQKRPLLAGAKMCNFNYADENCGSFLPHCVNGRRTSLMESKDLLKRCTFSCPLVGTGLECLHWSVFMRSQPLSSRWWRPGLVDNSKIRSPWQRRCFGPNEEDASSEKSRGKKWGFSTGRLEGSSRLEIKMIFPSLKFQDVIRKKAGNITAVNHLSQSTIWVWRDGWIKVGRVAVQDF